MKNKKLIAIIGVCVVLVAAVVGVFIVKDKKDDAKNPLTAASTAVAEAQLSEISEAEVAQTEPSVTFPPVTVTVTQEQLDKVVYSAQVGEVNGTTYAVINVGTVLDNMGRYFNPAETPVIPELPVTIDGYVTTFAQYGEYVYYVVTEDEKWGETHTLYRCKTDFTENEIIVIDDHSEKTSFKVYDYFAIADGKLYIPGIEEVSQKNKCIDLSTNEIEEFTPVEYEIIFGVTESERLEMYNGNIFIENRDLSDGKGAFAYHIVDYERIMMIDEKESAEILENYICGFANGKIYFSQVINSSDLSYNTVLKCCDVSTKEVEVVDKRFLGGNGNFFKQYSEAE